MTSKIRACGSEPRVGDPLSTAQNKVNELDARVQRVGGKHLDEFSAPNPLVATILTAETAGVARNGLVITADLVHKTSHVAIGLGCATAACYLIAGVIMTVVGGMLFPSCCADFRNAIKSDSWEEKWRSSLNLVDKCFLTAIGVALCVIGAFALAALVAATPAVAALSAVTISIASIVFAVLLTLRGAEMLMRGGYGLWKANQFQREFQEQSKKGDVANWLNEQKLKDTAALKNRIGQTAFDALAEGDFSQVDRGICEERLKQQLFLAIGTIMFVGGMFSLVAIGLSHGAVAPVVVTAFGVAGSSFSLSMEALWMPYDNPKWFKKLTEWSYRQHHA